MTPRRLGFGLLVLVSLLIVPAAAGTRVTVGATATIGGAGLNHRLTIKNTGTDPIKFWRYNLPAGVLVTAGGTQPTGWQLGAPGPLPQPTFGGRGDPGIAPGASATFPFTTNREYHGSGGPLGQLLVSSDGVTDVPVGLRLEPAAPPTCKCKSLKIERVRTRTSVAGPLSRIRMDFRWELLCTPEGGGTCGAMFRIVKPAKKFTFVIRPTTHRCKGTCKKLTIGSNRVSIPYKSDPRKSRFKGETFRLKIKKYCRRGVVYVPAGTQVATVVIGEDGELDDTQSDLDLNGIPDGDD